MTPSWLFLLALQSGADRPLVGDTVWVDREVRAPAGSLLRPRPWEPGEVASLLGPPEVVAIPGGWMLRYPLVFWRAGTHRLAVPGPLVIRADGGTDSLPARPVEIEVASLLPSGRADTLAPRPAAAGLQAAERSLRPVIVLILLTGLLLAPLHWWWRRRGPSRQEAPVTLPSALPDPVTLQAWADLGEYRVAADGWIARLETGPPHGDTQQLVAALRAARFESADTEELARLCREVSRP